MPYSFAWSVYDAASYNDYGHYESSDGNLVKGGYRVALPDGRRQVVTYYVEGDSGLVANIRYDGDAHHPDQNPSYGGAPPEKNAEYPEKQDYPAKSEYPVKPEYPAGSEYPSFNLQSPEYPLPPGYAPYKESEHPAYQGGYPSAPGGYKKPPYPKEGYPKPAPPPSTYPKEGYPVPPPPSYPKEGYPAPPPPSYPKEGYPAPPPPPYAKEGYSKPPHDGYSKPNAYPNEVYPRPQPYPQERYPKLIQSYPNPRYPGPRPYPQGYPRPQPYPREGYNNPKPYPHEGYTKPAPVPEKEPEPELKAQEEVLPPNIQEILDQIANDEISAPPPEEAPAAFEPTPDNGPADDVQQRIPHDGFSKPTPHDGFTLKAAPPTYHRPQPRPEPYPRLPEKYAAEAKPYPHNGYSKYPNVNYPTPYQPAPAYPYPPPAIPPRAIPPPYRPEPPQSSPPVYRAEASTPPPPPPTQPPPPPPPPPPPTPAEPTPNDLSESQYRVYPGNYRPNAENPEPAGETYIRYEAPPVAPTTTYNEIHVHEGAYQPPKIKLIDVGENFNPYGYSSTAKRSILVRVPAIYTQ